MEQRSSVFGTNTYRSVRSVLSRQLTLLRFSQVQPWLAQISKKFDQLEVNFLKCLPLQLSLIRVAAQQVVSTQQKFV